MLIAFDSSYSESLIICINYSKMLKKVDTMEIKCDVRGSCTVVAPPGLSLPYQSYHLTATLSSASQIFKSLSVEIITFPHSYMIFLGLLQFTP